MNNKYQDWPFLYFVSKCLKIQMHKCRLLFKPTKYCCVLLNTKWMKLLEEVHGNFEITDEYKRLWNKTKSDFLLTLFPSAYLIFPSTITTTELKQKQCLLEKTLKLFWKNAQPPILFTVTVRARKKFPLLSFFGKLPSKTLKNFKGKLKAPQKTKKKFFFEISGGL